MTLSRISRLNSFLSDYPFDLIILSAGIDLTYFCGLQFHLSERPVLLIISPGHEPILVHPKLEIEKVRSANDKLDLFAYDEDKASLETAIAAAFKKLKVKNKTIGVNPSMRFFEIELIKKASVGSILVSAADMIKHMRMLKEKNEILAIRKAVQIAEEALTKTVPFINPRKTEKEIAAELTIQLLKCGSDPDLPFLPIVASGPNSANPHAVPSDRPLQSGDILIIDWGARTDGYVSDITRTFSVGNPSDEFMKISNLVKQANQSAHLATKPGATADTIDCAARQIINRSGYGNFFPHRTGHGIGLEPHEEPYLQQGNQLRLENGMVHTIEPGIYLPGKSGVRIEDVVLVTEKGAETLTTIPRSITIINS